MAKLNLKCSFVHQLFAEGIASSTRATYSSGQVRYLNFCNKFGINPLPLTDRSLCLFAAFLANEGLRAQSISVYLSALHHLQIAAGLQAPPPSWLPYTYQTLSGPLRENLTSHASLVSRADLSGCISSTATACMHRIFWVLQARRTSSNFHLSICSPYAFRPIPLGPIPDSGADPFGHGAAVILGATGKDLCLVIAILNYLAVRPPGPGPLLIWQDSLPLLRDQFVWRVLCSAGLDHSLYSGHSFRIGAATSLQVSRLTSFRQWNDGRTIALTLDLPLMF